MIPHCHGLIHRSTTPKYSDLCHHSVAAAAINTGNHCRRSNVDEDCSIKYTNSNINLVSGIENNSYTCLRNSSVNDKKNKAITIVVTTARTKMTIIK